MMDSLERFPGLAEVFTRADEVPEALKAKYIPILKEVWAKQRAYMSAMESAPVRSGAEGELNSTSDDFLGSTETVLESFMADQGTPDQYDDLSMAVQFGHFGP